MNAALGALGNAGKSAVSYVTRASKSKWFWIALVALILFIIYRKNKDNIRSWFNKWFGAKDYDDKSGIANKIIYESITAERKTELEGTARELFDRIEQGYFRNYKKLENLLCEVAVYDDTELKYLAEYYKKYISNKSLYSDVENMSWPLWMSGDTKIMTKLKKIGMI